MSTRQYKWAKKQVEKGKCSLCNRKHINGHYCKKHLKLQRILARNYYRRQHGIPLDAPLYKCGAKAKY